MNKQKKFKELYQNSVFATGQFYVKLVITIFLIALYLVLFFYLDGVIYFESNIYCSAFKNQEFQVHMIAVENGDAILLKLPTGKTMLIDTGEEIYYSRLFSYIRQYNYYEKTKTIDYLLLTHADSDHIGGAKELIEEFNVKNIIRPKLYSNYEAMQGLATENYNIEEGRSYNEVIKTGYEHNCNFIFADKGLELQFGDCLVEFLSPKLDSYNQSNNYSAVIMVSYLDKKFLFTGDAEEHIEKQLIEDFGDYLKADVLKVAHHGSNTSTSQEFLNYVNPKYALISSSGSSSILPSYKVIERLEANGIEVLATGNLKNFALAINKNEITFKKAKKSPNNLVLILAIFIIFDFIVWKNPFKQKTIFFDEDN